MPDTMLERRPRLRDVAVRHVEFRGQAVYLLWDEGRPAADPVPLTEPGLYVAGRFNGRLTVAEIAAECSRRLDSEVPADFVGKLLLQLDDASLLVADGDAGTMAAGASVRPPLRLFARDDADANRGVLSEILASRKPAPVAGRIAGLIAPHLDYERGGPCYAEAYGLPTLPTAARRFVVLGTNHFGRSWPRLVGADCDFRTPLGTARNDRAFLARLNDRLSTDLCIGDLDHFREHSVELQVRFLQHLFGDGFTFVPFLCPDPCGPTGTRPRDGRGADLDDFAAALAEEIAADPVPTCVIAGADLAHIGRNFGDEERLNPHWLDEVRRQDRALLDCVGAGDPEGIIAHLRADENARRVCSAGCIYTLCKTLLAAGAEPRVLDYHQAVDHRTQTAVTCAAAVFTAPAGGGAAGV